jgi:alkylhydroperoxidase/carboxymuconolactone decarboxylase family protein YurZ
MTVTEVTTRIAIVGVAGIIGLLLVSRAQLLRRHEPAVGGHRRFAQPHQPLVAAASLPLGRAALRRSGTLSSRTLGLVVMTIAVGLSVGIGLSVALVAALGALGLGAN